jgi:hypothetical protein
VRSLKSRSLATLYVTLTSLRLILREVDCVATSSALDEQAVSCGALDHDGAPVLEKFIAKDHLEWQLPSLSDQARAGDLLAAVPGPPRLPGLLSYLLNSGDSGKVCKDLPHLVHTCGAYFVLSENYRCAVCLRR